MSESRELPRTLSTAIPAIPAPAPSAAAPTASEEEARARIAALEREARALGAVPQAALLFHEMGLLWESALRHPRNAAVAYQSAFKLAPRFLANIRAARRLFGEVGNWSMVVQLLDAELAATEAKGSRAALLFEKSQVLEQRLSRDADATSALAQCLELAPDDITLLVQLEAVFAEKQDYQALVKVDRLLASAVSEDAARAVYLTSAGLLLEDRLKDLAGAAALFRQAFAVDRRDPQLLAAMKRVAQREGTVDEELAALAAEAESQGPLAGPTFLQIAKAYERLNRPQDALAALLAARRVSPGDPLILAELSRVYEAEGRHSELADVLLGWTQLNTDESEFVAQNLRLASLYEQLRRDDEAAARYKAILGRVAGHGQALAGLGKLYHRLQNWQGLLETYEAEAAATDDPRQRAGRVYKAGETLEEHLGRVDEAIARYAQCLQLSPGYLPAQKALIRLYERLGRWGELIGMYEQDLLQTTDREQQITLLNKIAGLYEDRIGDVGRAVECLKRVLDLAADHLPTMRNLARLYERAGEWKALLELNDREASLASDTKQIVSLAHRNAEILEEQLKDRPAAVTAWERVLQLSPNYPPALRSLGRLYGQDGRWEALIRMYRSEAELSPAPEQAASLIQKIGELYEQKLTDVDQAVASYREVLMLSPSHVPALRALARIYRAQGAWESLIEILHAEAASRSDPTERANAMFQAAGIWEDELDKPQQAIDAYKEVLRLAPGHITAQQQLERLLTARDDLKELIVLLDRQAQAGPEAARVAAHLKLARLYLDRLNEPGRAASSCESALALDGRNLTALRLLERIRASDPPRRAELRVRLAEAVGDAKLAAAIRLSTVEATDPLATPPAEVIAELKRAFAAEPADESLGLALERALLRTRDAAGLVDLYTRRRALVVDQTDQLQLLLRIAELHEQALADPRAGLAAYEAALALAPDLFPALVGRARCAMRVKDPALAQQSLERLAATTRDPTSATQALLEAAGLARDHQRDENAAIALYQQVLSKEPLHPEAGPALEELLARRGGATDLLGLHEKRGEAKLAQRDAAAAAREFLHGARVALETMQDRPRALALVDRALKAQPTMPEALELKGTLAYEAKAFADAAQAWAARVQQGGEPRQLARLQLKLGALYHDQLQDHTRAAAYLQSVVSTDPTSVEALERLASIHTASRNWTGAADCLRRLLDLESSIPARAKYTLALARLSDEGFNDVGQAITLYRRALELTPGDLAALDRLVQLYERTGALSELVEILERQAQQASDVKKAVALKTRIAQIQARNMGDPQRSAITWRQVIDVDPTNVAAHVALAELYSRDTSSIALAIEAHRNVLKLDPTRVESLHALFRMWESLRQLDKAFCVAGILSFLKATNDGEAAYYGEGRNRLPLDFRGVLATPDLVALHHPAARGPLVDVLRAVGDQFGKLYPPQLENLGVDRRADRLKADSAVLKAFATVADLVGADAYEAFQSRRGTIAVETGEPLAVCISGEMVRRLNIREQRVLYGRAALMVVDRTAITRKVAPSELADLLGAAVRIHQPQYEGLGRKNDELVKQLRKAFSRKALKALEEPADAAMSAPRLPLDALVQALVFSQDRAGVLAGADVATALMLLLRDEGSSGARLDSSEGIIAAVAARPDVKELMTFVLSEEHFRLRARVGMSLG